MSHSPELMRAVWEITAANDFAELRDALNSAQMRGGWTEDDLAALSDAVRGVTARILGSAPETPET